MRGLIEAGDALGTGSHGRDDAEIATATVFAELELSLLLETNVYRAENNRSTLFNISISVKIPGLVKIFFTFLRAFRLPPSAFRLPPSAWRAPQVSVRAGWHWIDFGFQVEGGGFVDRAVAVSGLQDHGAGVSSRNVRLKALP